MSRILHRGFNADLPVAVSAKGIEISDAGGKSYIDASGGAAVSCLGHNHPDVRAAMHAQIDALDYAHSSFFTTEPAEKLAAHVIGRAPEGLSRMMIVSSGSEAVEACLKLARHFFNETGRGAKRFFISRRQSYHGITAGGLSVGGRLRDRAPFADMLMPVRHISPCHEYRGRLADETLEAYGQRMADELDAAIRDLGAENVAAFVAEPVVGATLGAATAAPGYFKRIREICDIHDVLLILDEVMCGMGRTGSLFACEQEGISPDLMAIAKGLGGGYAPIGAMLVSERIADAIARGPGFFPHSQTYNGHPLACAAGLAVQQVIERDNLLANVRRQGDYLSRRLAERFGNHHNVGDIRGRGLFQALEFVTDRASKEPFDPALKLSARVKQAAMARGLLVYPMGGAADGIRGDHVLLAPPFIVSEADVDEIVSRLGDAVDDALTSTGNR